MANELVIVTLLGNQGDPVEYTVADGTAITKGTLMELTSAKTAVKVSGAGVAIAGIAATDKAASDGVTKLACITNAVVTGTTLASTGNAVIGEYLRSGGADNTLEQATTLDHETGKAVIKALATVGASATVEGIIRV